MTRSPPDSESRVPSDEAYERHKRRAADRQAEKSRQGRDIENLPPVANPQRRERCRLDLRLCLETYFRPAFPLAWSDRHLKVIGKIQDAVFHGGLFALAMPRGDGKTTMCEHAVIWACLYGHVRYAMLILADMGKAKKSLAKTKQRLETNDLLLADFPEVCVPVRALERIANRCNGQTYQGQPTYMEWSKEAITLPTIAGSVSSGAVIKTGALLSATRGANHARPDGVIVRPKLVLLDDPQTRTSARSESQSALREQIVSADVLGMAGPEDTITALMPCTVIQQGDMAHRMLNRKLHPEWRGEILRMVDQFPTPAAMRLWEEYRELSADLYARDLPPLSIRKKLNAFYKKHRSAMDEGAIVGWEARKGDGPLSALQYAMELYWLDQSAFASEYQNEPLGGAEQDDELQPADQLARRVNGIGRGQVPLKAKHITAAIDVHKELLYWMLCWWDDDFTGGVLDYGTYPDQGRLQFTLRQAQPTLQQATGRKSPLAAVRAGLNTLIGRLFDRVFERPDHARLQCERLLVDANWGRSTNIVYDACRESPHHTMIRPSHGKGIKARGKPMASWVTNNAEKAGHHWIRRSGKRAQQFLTIDVNYWKSFVHDALALDPEEKHSLSLFQAKPHEHRLLAEHLIAEERIRDEADGRQVDVWSVKTGKPDNHWLDCLVECAVGASEGCKIVPPGTSQTPRPRKKLTAEEIRARREAQRV